MHQEQCWTCCASSVSSSTRTFSADPRRRYCHTQLFTARVWHLDDHRLYTPARLGHLADP